MNEIKLRGYKLLLEAGRIVIDQVPEPYKSAILSGE